MKKFVIAGIFFLALVSVVAANDLYVASETSIYGENSYGKCFTCVLLKRLPVYDKQGDVVYIQKDEVKACKTCVILKEIPSYNKRSEVVYMQQEYVQKCGRCELVKEAAFEGKPYQTKAVVYFD